MKTIIPWLVTTLLGLPMLSNSQVPAEALPKVYMIGEYTETTESLFPLHKNLMEVCENDMTMAYKKWLHMLGEMDKLSVELGVDLKGVKVWLNVFWNPDGTIKHLAFHPKPTSKNQENAVLRAFFINFVEQYKMVILSDVPFMHYGSAAFPTLHNRLTVKK